MAAGGEAITYGELERRTNRLAHLLRAQGLSRLDHYSIFMENNARYVECCGAGERVGALLHLHQLLPARPRSWPTSWTTAESKVLITSQAKLEVALEARRRCARRSSAAWSSTGRATAGAFVNLDEAAGAACPDTPIADEWLGTPMLYSSGTTGRPKGIMRPLPETAAGQPLPLFDFLTELWRYREGMIYLSPAPLYHSAPQAAVSLTIRAGGTAVIMEHFDPEQYLALVEQLPGHPQPAGADDVLAHAEAARGGARAATTCRRWRSRSTPPRRARCRSRSR